jgi:hypothetical protein
MKILKMSRNMSIGKFLGSVFLLSVFVSLTAVDAMALGVNMPSGGSGRCKKWVSDGYGGGGRVCVGNIENPSDPKSELSHLESAEEAPTITTTSLDEF